MLNAAQRAERGFSLVELLVVMSILVILAALAVPTMNQLGVFGGSDLRRASRELFAFLNAAKVYAATHGVDAAVVYRMDGPSGPEVVDSVTGLTVRVIQAASVMYALPVAAGPVHQGKFVPVPRGLGEFRDFPALTAILLYDEDTMLPIYNFHPARTLFDSDDDRDPNDADNINFGIATLGMRAVEAYLEPEVNADGTLDDNFWVELPAHVFTPEGRVDPRTPGDGREYPEKERYRILVAPSPDEGWDRRLIDVDNMSLPRNLMTIPIEIYKSTARLRIAS